MNTFSAQILTPEGTVFDGDITGIQVPGTEGSFEVKVNHAPILSTLEIGKVRIRHTDNPDELFAVSGGFLELNDNKLTLLAEAAEAQDEIDVQRAREAKKRAKKRLADTDREEVDRKQAEKALRRAEVRLFVAQQAQ
jgi:F-type H+-transporting ATPase subunit epsilon